MLLRPPPPPLQLLHDNTVPESERRPITHPHPRPPPPRAQWRLVKVFKKLYRSDWRTAVIAVAAINGMRFLFSATNAFEHLTPVTRYYFPRLARISATLGGLYITTAVIQAFGILSAFLKRIWLIRIYTYLSLLCALLISTAGIVSGLSYFLLGEDLITECIALSLSGSHRTRGLYHSRHLRRSGLPSLRTAYHQCVKAYSNPTTPAPLLPLSLILFSLLPSALFFLLSYVYYKQTIDPTHPACLIPGIRNTFKPGNRTPTHIPTHTGASTSANAERGTESQGRTTVKRERGKGKATTSESKRRAVRPRKAPSALPLERLSLLGHTSSSSVDITSTNPLNPSSVTDSPYNISPGPPSFGGGRTGVAAVAGPSRLAGRGAGVEVRGVSGKSVWFAKASESGSGGSGNSDGYGYSLLGYSYPDAYGGRLI